MAKWTPAADVFSFGVTICCICNLEPKPPTAGKVVQISDQYPKDLRDLVDRCVDRDSTKRPTIANVVSTLSDLVEKHEHDFASKCPEVLLETGSIGDRSLAIALLIICLVLLVQKWIYPFDKKWMIFLEAINPAWALSVWEGLCNVVLFGAGVWLGVFISGSRGEILLVSA